MDLNNIMSKCTRTEFVGTSVLDTIGLVISGIDSTLLAKMNIGTKYKALGMISARTGAAGQLTAMDDAVKASNTELLSVDLARDTKGGGGHGCLIVIGGTDISDVRHAIGMGLELTKKYSGEVYVSDGGHMELAYSASAGAVLQKALGAKPNQAFGFMAACPAGIGLVMADNAVKASSTELVTYMTPSFGTSHTNEIIAAFSGDAGAVKSAVLAARRVGLELLPALGYEVSRVGTSYLSEGF